MILETISAGVATLTFNRPELHNAFNDEFIQKLIEILERINGDPKVHVVVLAANGKSFCAGADLNWMRRMADYSLEENHEDALALARLMHTLYTLEKPTIALIQGAAMGGGVGLAACCDITIASEPAIFCLSEVKIGLIPAVISPYVIAAMGERAARRYFLTAEAFTSHEAYRLGLVHQVVPLDALTTTGELMAKTLLNNSPGAIRVAKKLIQDVVNQPLNQALIEKTAAYIADIRISAEGQEGLKAFLEKRKPNWLFTIA
jgi:methylglutaconyl-CoA hydratase